MGKETSNIILEELKEQENGLANLIQDFAEMAIQRSFQIRCFYETRETQLANAVVKRWIAKLLPEVKVHATITFARLNLLTVSFTACFKRVCLS